MQPELLIAVTTCVFQAGRIAGRHRASGPHILSYQSISCKRLLRPERKALAEPSACSTDLRRCNADSYIKPYVLPLLTCLDLQCTLTLPQHRDACHTTCHPFMFCTCWLLLSLSRGHTSTRAHTNAHAPAHTYSHSHTRTSCTCRSSAVCLMLPFNSGCNAYARVPLL